MPSITKEYYHNIDLLANQLLNSRLHNITTAARIILGSTLTAQNKGYQVYDTDLLTPFYWSGYTWNTTLATWGSITGTLSNQTDLQTALNAKYDDPTGTTSQYIRGDGSIATFPSIPTVTPAALTKTNDTNVTLTLGGTPSTALLQAVSLTLGWTGTLDDSRITSASTWNSKEPGITAGTTSQYWRGDKSWQTLDKSAVGLGNVENTALSTWAGSTNITTLGTITSGTWHGSSIGDSYISSASTWNAKQNALSGSGIVKSTLGTISYISGISSQFIKGDGSLDSSTYLTAAVTSVGASTGMNFTTITGTGNVAIDTAKVPYYATIPSNGLLNYISGTWGVDTNNYLTTAVTSVSLSVPSAFTVSGSPVTGIGTLSFAGAGSATQYIRGDGVLADFPTNTGGGSVVNYYLNGSISQGIIGGNSYYQMSKTPVIGGGTNFNISTNGYIGYFITDTLDPSLLSIPAGSWNFKIYMSANSNGGSPSFYLELYKYNGSSFTLIADGSSNQEMITGGTSVDLYYTSLAVPLTSLTTSDRLAIRIYVNNSGKTITLHTENDTLAQVSTTFSTGLTALNGSTAQVQYFQTGTANTDFGIDSLTTPGTHIFNLPVASDTNTGKLSSTDYTTFTNKASKGFAVAMAAAL